MEYVFHGTDPATYAVIDAAGDVHNIVQWDGVLPYDPGPGLRLAPYEPEVHTFAPVADATAEPHTPVVLAEPFMTPMPDEVSMAEAHIDPVVAETPKKRRWWSRNKG